MLAWESTVECRALRARGGSISAIARHLEINRCTVRHYLADQRHPGFGGRRAWMSSPGLSSTPGYGWSMTHICGPRRCMMSWSSLATGIVPESDRALRARRLRRHCEPCAASKGRDHAIIAHPPHRKPSGIGSSYPTRRRRGGGARPRTCWLGRWRTRRGGGWCWLRPRTSRI